MTVVTISGEYQGDGSLNCAEAQLGRGSMNSWHTWIIHKIH